MAVKYEPEIGNWYQSSNNLLFKIVAIDEHDETIEIQYFDGTLGELELESWSELMADLLDAPDGWSGPFDNMEDEHSPLYDETATSRAWDSGVVDGFDDD